MLILLLGLGLWSSFAQISGAVLGTGHIEVTTTRTAVQHPIGGVVVDILKRDGDAVTAGDVLVRLDDRNLRSELAITEDALWEVLANTARLEAVIEDRRELTIPPLLHEAADHRPEVRTLIERQQRQLADHHAMIDNKTRLIDETIVQTRYQIEGVTAQMGAKAQELEVLAAEKSRAEGLEAQGLIRQAEMAALEKDAIAARGEVARFAAQIAELQVKITQTDLSRLAVISDARDLARAELGRLRPDITKLTENRRLLLQDLSLLEVRAPVSGRIIESQIMGLRSVIVAASPLMMIVPKDEAVLARVRIDARDIDQVFTGQDASLRFTAFNGRQVPIILGTVVQVSADAFLDPRSQVSYYEVAIEIGAEVEATLGGSPLIPGMPVDAFLATQSRTPLDYVLRPIRFYFDRAFRDA